MARGVKIKLDKERHLRVTSQAIADFERVTGKPLVAESTLSNLSLRDFVTIVWALLLHEDSQLTIKQVRGMIRPLGKIKELRDKIVEACDAYAKEMDQ